MILKYFPIKIYNLLSRIPVEEIIETVVYRDAF